MKPGFIFRVNSDAGRFGHSRFGLGCFGHTTDSAIYLKVDSPTICTCIVNKTIILGEILLRHVKSSQYNAGG
jgi:hypothetical protein